MDGRIFAGYKRTYREPSGLRHLCFPYKCIADSPLYPRFSTPGSRYLDTRLWTRNGLYKSEQHYRGVVHIHKDISALYRGSGGLRRQLFGNLCGYSLENLTCRVLGKQVMTTVKKKQKGREIVDPKRKSTFAPEQIRRLEEEFLKQQYIVLTDREHLAREVGITEQQIKVWFQNRRIKWRKKQRIRALAPQKTLVEDFGEENTTMDNRNFTSSRHCDVINDTTSENAVKGLY